MLQSENIYRMLTSLKGFLQGCTTSRKCGHTTLVTFPKNTTSCTQPMDAGVIQSWKFLLFLFSSYSVYIYIYICRHAKDSPWKEEKRLRCKKVVLEALWENRQYRVALAMQLLFITNKNAKNLQKHKLFLWQKHLLMSRKVKLMNYSRVCGFVIREWHFVTLWTTHNCFRALNPFGIETIFIVWRNIYLSNKGAGRLVTILSRLLRVSTSSLTAVSQATWRARMQQDTLLMATFERLKSSYFYQMAAFRHCVERDMKASPGTV